MKIWITTDTHFNHAKLVEWGRPADFGERILKNLRKEIEVGAFDGRQMVIHLGDLAIGNDKEAIYKFVLATPNCRRILVRGNHDAKSDNWYIQNGFDFVCEAFTNTHRGKRIIFSHIPVPKSDLFDLNLHGHCHGSNHRDKDKPANYDPAWHYDCAPDTHSYRPIWLDTITK